MWPLSWSSKGAVFVFAEIIWIEKKMSVLDLYRTLNVESCGLVSREFHTQNSRACFGWFSSTYGRVRSGGSLMKGMQSR